MDSWGLTRGILSETKMLGGIALAPLASYALWIHSQAFVKYVHGTTPGGVRTGSEFAAWANAVGLVLVLDMLPFIKLAPWVRQPPGHLGTSCVAYSRLLRRFPAPPPPLACREIGLGVCHSSLFADHKGRSVVPRAVVRRGYAKWGDVFWFDYLRRDVARQLNPQWWVWYAAMRATEYAVQVGLAEWRQRAPCDMGSWAAK